MRYRTSYRQTQILKLHLFVVLERGTPASGAASPPKSPRKIGTRRAAALTVRPTRGLCRHFLDYSNFRSGD